MGDKFVSYRLFQIFETMLGLYPYRLVFPLNGINKPKLKFSKIRFVFTALHLVSFLISNWILFYLYRCLPMSTSTGTFLELVQTKFIDGMASFCTFTIFFSIFLYRDRHVRYQILIRKFDRHCEALGVNIKKIYKNMTYFSLFVIIFIFVWLTSIYLHGIFYWFKILDNEMFLVFGTADMIPVIYTQLIFIQFCVILLFLRKLWNKLNVILMEVYKMERAKNDLNNWTSTSYTSKLVRNNNIY